MKPAPPPLNLASMADAWDNPDAFCAALNSYYVQLREQGYDVPPPDITNERTPQDD
ncbi:hypothetical protein [Microbacterium sp. 1.5R]|uniref:hypothetical protein n=1 Tax=Microbacterium sp. 1.5R TaxID=1916917 RepID=UPI001642CA3F|nr:hypothetical protein [Microbacterium sp. 1.5R]